MNEINNNPAFLYGESVFTTCLVKNKRIQLWNEHLNQLLDNAISYYFLSESDRTSLEKLVFAELDKMQIDDGVLRVTICSKSRETLFTKTDIQDLAVSVNQRKITSIAKPLKLKTIKRLQSELLDQIKIGSYGKEFYLKKFYQKEGFDDLLFIGEDKVFESTTSNIFFVKKDQLFTPQSGVYKGITRKQILTLNKVEERQILVTEIKSFDGAFLCNSIHGIVPIDSIDNIQFSQQDFSLIKF